MAARVSFRSSRCDRTYRAAIGFINLALLIGACGVAPVHKGAVPEGPPTWIYDGPHGRPLAYGGDVCEVAGRHGHEYPPSPSEAFAHTARGLKDTRPTWAYFGAHPHHGRTCFREGWHRHLEPPDPALVYDDAKAAWRLSPSPSSAPR